MPLMFPLLDGILPDPVAGVKRKVSSQGGWRKMSRRALYGCGGLLAGLLLTAAGCSKADTERLARVGRKVTEKAGAISSSTNERLHAGWQNFPVNLEGTSLAARVSNRLRWDRELVNTPIEVRATGPVVELKGAVAGLPQRQRAVGLAETTLGVEKVVDCLVVPGSE